MRETKDKWFYYPVVKNIFSGEIVYEMCKRNFLGDDFLHLKRFREK